MLLLLLSLRLFYCFPLVIFKVPFIRNESFADFRTKMKCRVMTLEHLRSPDGTNFFR